MDEVHPQQLQLFATPNAERERHRQVTRVASVIATLGPDALEVLRSRYAESLSLGQAAERMGTSRIAVRRIERHALRSIASALAGAEGSGR